MLTGKLNNVILNTAAIIIAVIVIIPFNIGEGIIT